jgi:Kdo2-lipid IVA lauroyltransferase/acyltransferase
MAKPRSALADFSVYLTIRLFVCIIQTLSFATALAFARGLAWFAFQINRRHRHVALDNLEKAFPDRYTLEEREELVRDVYRHFCSVLIEIVHMPRRLNVFNWKKHLELPDGQRIVECLLSGRPLLVVTGHFGNWEMAGYCLGLLGFPTHAIARPLDNPFLDDFVRRFREATGQKILAKHGDFAKIQGVLDKGGVLATLGDQDAGQRGLFVDFFGRPASTHKAVALLALEHQVPMVVTGTARMDGVYHVMVADIIFPEEYEGRPNAVKELTQRFSTALEGLVRRHPEQYFWLHRRWKHRPARRKTAAVA